MAGKEAVVFVLDANLTMDAPYPSPPASEDGASALASQTSSTRLTQAKDAALATIIDLMWHSKTHEAGVVVLRAGATHHHLSELERIDDEAGVGKFFRRCGGGAKLEKYKHDDGSDGDVFPNLVELELGRPSPPMLRAMRDIQCTINASIASNVQGDLCDGLILAADALHRRTAGKKYNRKIVIISDAEHEVEVNGEQLQCVLDGLNKMEVQLIVVGIGFEPVVVPPKIEDDSDDEQQNGNEEVVAIGVDDSDDDSDKMPEAVASKPTEADNGDVLVKEEGNPDEMLVKEEGNPDEMLVEDAVKQENDIGLLIKRENEKLLLSVAQETGGCILAANGTNLTELLQTKLPQRAGMTKSVGKKSEFRIAPDITVVAKAAKLTDKKNLPTTLKEAYQYDPETGKPLRDGAGELMTQPTKTYTYHYDEEENEVAFDKRTDAYRYGSDLIPVGKMDLQGINAAFSGPASIETLGYLDRATVESSNLLMGPAYAFTGGDSKKSRAAIAALSQALEETGKVGLCRVVRTKNGEPKIGAMFPKREGRNDDDDGDGSLGPEAKGKGGRYLAFLELPFADDLSQLEERQTLPTEWQGDYKDVRVCDDLIDSMMLPDDEFRSEKISFPALKAHQQMVAHFAMNPLSEEEEMDKEGLAEEKIAEASRAKPLAEFDVVKALSKRAASQIDSFVDKFPLAEHKPEDDKKRKFWGES
ncbi:hypothetical protein ACHAXT_006795 [Thalassiosira profunda]